MLDIYIFTCNKQYGGGMAVVAATDAIEAFNLLCDEYGGDEFVYDYTDLDNCKVSENLFTNVSKPQVLESDFYTE